MYIYICIVYIYTIYMNICVNVDCNRLVWLRIRCTCVSHVRVDPRLRLDSMRCAVSLTVCHSCMCLCVCHVSLAGEGTDLCNSADWNFFGSLHGQFTDQSPHPWYSTCFLLKLLATSGYTHMHMHTHSYAYTCTYIYIYIHAHTILCTHTLTHSYTCVLSPSCAHRE